jgi:hypothetical protein
MLSKIYKNHNFFIFYKITWQDNLKMTWKHVIVIFLRPFLLRNHVFLCIKIHGCDTLYTRVLKRHIFSIFKITCFKFLIFCAKIYQQFSKHQKSKTKPRGFRSNLTILPEWENKTKTSLKIVITLPKHRAF